MYLVWLLRLQGTFKLSKATLCVAPWLSPHAVEDRELGDQIYILKSSLWLWSPGTDWRKHDGRPFGAIQLSGLPTRGKVGFGKGHGGRGGKRSLRGDPSSQAENFPSES